MNYSILQLHLATSLFGLAGVIGRSISTSVLAVVALRAALGAVSLFLWARKSNISVRLPQEHRWHFIGIGLLLATHWYCFFLSIRLTSVAIGLLTYACYPAFNLMVTFAARRQRIGLYELARLTVPLLGLKLLLPDLDSRDFNTLGVLTGVGSGILFSIMQFVNGRLVKGESPVKISLYQNGIAACFLMPLVDRSMLPSSLREQVLILVLGVACTAVAHTVFISGLRGVTNRTASYFAYLEPVYGIALAALLLQEVPSMRNLAGGAMILGIFVFERES